MLDAISRLIVLQVFIFVSGAMKRLRFIAYAIFRCFAIDFKENFAL